MGIEENDNGQGNKSMVNWCYKFGNKFAQKWFIQYYVYTLKMSICRCLTFNDGLMTYLFQPIRLQYIKIKYSCQNNMQFSAAAVPFDSNTPANSIFDVYDSQHPSQVFPALNLAFGIFGY